MPLRLRAASAQPYLGPHALFPLLIHGEDAKRGYATPLRCRSGQLSGEVPIRAAIDRTAYRLCRSVNAHVKRQALEMPSCPKCSTELQRSSTTCFACGVPPDTDNDSSSESTPVRPFEPTVPAWQWLLYAAASLACLLYALYGFVTGEMYLPGRRRMITLHGAPAVLLATAFLCYASHLAMSLLGYPDRPDTTELQAAFAEYTRYAAVALLFGAIFASAA